MIVEIPDFAAFQQFMQTEQAAEAIRTTGSTPTPSWSSLRDEACRALRRVFESTQRLRVYDGIGSCGRASSV
jgi:hypothetical protein